MNCELSIVNCQLILFDIDGTLVWTRGAGREATRRAMLEIFGTCGAIAAHPFGGKTDWRTLVELLLSEGMTHAEIERRIPDYNLAMGRHITEVIPQYDVIPCTGAIELVQTLRQRDDLLLGVVTGNVTSAAPVKLRAAGFDPAWFPIGAYGDEAMDRDHLPPLALARANQLARTPIPPEAVIVVGDTPADISCARALGAVAVGVETGFCQPSELAAARPDYQLKDLTEFWRVLQ
jgi:phosphoglycolate phosphatase-like HAD superfamily hydrolase